jgi:arginine decarboxylase
VDPQVLAARADLLNTTSPSALIYAGLDGWRRQMVEHGEELLGGALRLAARVREAIDEIPGIRGLGRDGLVGPGRAADHDPLKIVIDLHELGRTGYRANEWLREHEQVDMGVSDHRRIAAQLTVADDEGTADRLVDAVRHLVESIDQVPESPPVALPEPGELEAEQARLPATRSSGRPSRCPPGTRSAGSRRRR